MCPSSSPDPAAWRSDLPQPTRRWPLRRPKHPWITALLVALAVLLGLGGLGALLEEKDRPPSEPPPVAVETTETPAEPAPKSSAAFATEPPPVAAPRPRGTPAPPAAQRPKPAPRSVVMLRVIDGDTIEVRGDGKIIPAGAKARVRLLEIDTPEKGACYAREATARTGKLLPVGSRLRVERDKQLKDQYKRYLLYVWNQRGVFVNESLVRSGHAKSVLYQPNDKYWARISKAESVAEGRLGLWKTCPAAPVAPRPKPAPSPSNARPPGLPAGPPAGIPDVDCSDLSGPVWVGSSDPHRLDRDGDGIGCDAA
jgi:micrococcal nuclease